VRRSPRRRTALLLLAAALGAPIVAPAAADPGPPPTSSTQQVAVQGDDGSVVPLEVTTAELAALRADPATGPVVARGQFAQTELAQAVPKVGAPSQWDRGFRGAGKVIVVIDTGVASGFGGSLVGQACFAATQAGTRLIGHCGPANDAPQAFDSTCFTLGVCNAANPDHVFDATAGRPCPSPARPEDCAHGTSVAGVAARHEPTPGVAPDAGVYAIRVFNPQGSKADLIDILLALDHARRLSDAGLDIAAVNLSVATSSTFAGACDTGAAATDEALAFRQAFAELEVRGVATAVASGNEGKRGAIAFPACVSTAISVGATDLDDELADFGNRAPGLDLLAPGADEGNGTIDPLDIPGGTVTQWAGTSFSAPFVSGAFALLEPQYPKATVAQLVGFLRDTGVPVSDWPTGASYRRLALKPPAQALRAQVLFPTALALGGAARGAIGDFDGDGHADVLAHGPGDAPDRISYGRDDWRVTARSYTVGGSYAPVVGNFRGTPLGADDILWYAPGPATDRLWVGDASRNLPSVAVNVVGVYIPVVADYDGDGFDDIFWYAPGPAGDSLMFGGPAGFTSVPVSVAGSYRVAAGDFDGDGREDLVFHGPGTAPDSLWRGTAGRGQWVKTTLSIGGTRTLQAGDLDGDGDDDLLLYEPGAAPDAIWRGGPSGFASMAVTVNGTYRPSIGDVDGDGLDDVLWYAPGAVGDFLWFGRPAGPLASRALTVSGTYSPLLGDLDADAGDELVWFNTAATTPVWWSHPG
jgi:hypothetical protein